MPTVLQVRRNEERQQEGASRPRRFKSTKSENAGCGKKRSVAVAAEGNFFFHPPTQTYQKYSRLGLHREPRTVG